MSVPEAATVLRVRGRLNALAPVLVRATVGTLVINAVATLLNFAVTVVLSRVLGARGYGAYAYAFAWAMLLSIPAVLGLTPLVIRNVAAYEVKREWGLARGLVRRANQAVVASSIVLIGAAGVIGWFVHRQHPELRTPFLVALALIPIVALTSIRQAAMQGIGRVVLGRLPETIVTPAIFLAFVFGARAATRHLSPADALICQIGAGVVALALGAYLLRRVMPAQVRDAAAAFEMRPWVRSAVPLIAFSGLQALNAQIEVILLGLVKGEAQAGLFAVASRASAIIAFVYVAASYALAPALARMHAESERQAFERTVDRGARALLLISLPIAVGVIVFAHPLLGLFGNDFKGGTTTLVLLAAGQTIWVGTGLSGMVLIATGHESRLTRAVAFGVAGNLALNGTLIPLFGLVGAGAASAVGTVAMGFWIALYARRSAGFPTTAFGL